MINVSDAKNDEVSQITEKQQVEQVERPIAAEANQGASGSEDYDDFETSEPDESQTNAQIGARQEEKSSAEQLMVQPRADSLIVYEEVTVPEQNHH